MSKETTLEVLRKAADSDSFLAQLADDPARALEGYALTLEEKGAISSGDVRWLKNHVGKLDKVLMTWPKCRLEQENW